MGGLTLVGGAAKGEHTRCMGKVIYIRYEEKKRGERRTSRQANRGKEVRWKGKLESSGGRVADISYIDAGWA